MNDHQKQEYLKRAIAHIGNVYAEAMSKQESVKILNLVLDFSEGLSDDDLRVLAYNLLEHFKYEYEMRLSQFYIDVKLSEIIGDRALIISYKHQNLFFIRLEQEVLR